MTIGHDKPHSNCGKEDTRNPHRINIVENKKCNIIIKIKIEEDMTHETGIQIEEGKT